MLHNSCPCVNMAAEEQDLLLLVLILASSFFNMREKMGSNGFDTAQPQVTV